MCLLVLVDMDNGDPRGGREAPAAIQLAEIQLFVGNIAIPIKIGPYGTPSIQTGSFCPFAAGLTVGFFPLSLPNLPPEER